MVTVPAPYQKFTFNHGTRIGIPEIGNVSL